MANNSDISIFQSVFKVGTVCSVDGREVRVKVDKLKNSSHLIFKGELVKNVSVGSYIKIIKGFIQIIGKVETEFIVPSKENSESKYSTQEERINRELKIKLLGYLENDKYCRGIKELPLIDNECFLLTNKEFEQIHRFVSDDSDIPLQIGSLASDSFVPIKLGVKALFSSHIGIFGNTGSGKSYTLSKLYRQLFVYFEDNDNFKANAKFLFLDFNGEYAGKNVIVSNKKVYNLSTRQKKDTLPFSNEDLLNLDLLCIFANATEKTQRPFIKRCIDLMKIIQKDKNNREEEENHFKNILRRQIKDILCMSDKVKAYLLLDYVENILPKKFDSNGIAKSLRTDFNFHDTHKYFYAVVAETKAHDMNIPEHPELVNDLNIYKQVDTFTFSNNFINKFINIMYIQLIYDVLNNRAMNEHIAPAINKLKSIEADIEKLYDFSEENTDFWKNNNIVVVNLSNVNLESKKIIPMLLAHKLYKEHKAKKEEDLSYLNIIVDEAHNILSYQSNRESETWKDYRLEVFEEIIKEGRKFGVFMTIASQRPSDISSTIISQLHNYFIHRLVNENDIEKVN